MSELQGAAIGAGYFSHFHYDAWNRLPGAEIVACCDTDLAKAEAVADRYAIPHVYNDYRRMLDRHAVNFVDLITRPDTHLAIGVDVIARGIPLICQKPLAPTIAEACQLVAAANTADVRFMVHENFRFQPWYREIKRLLVDGKIGSTLHTISYRNRAGDGWGQNAYLDRQPYFREMQRFLLFEAGIHTVDTFRFLAGEIQRVWCHLRKLNPVIAGEDTGICIFEFAAGGIGMYDANRYNESAAENQRYTFGEVLVEADAGSIRLHDDGRLTIQRLGEPEQNHEYHHTADGFGGDCVFATQQHFVDRLRDGKPFETSGDDYLKSLAVQEAMYRSATTDGWERPQQPAEVASS